MIKLTHGEREVRSQRNKRRDRAGKIRRKFKLDRDEPLNRDRR